MIKKGQYTVLSFFLTRSLFMIGIYSLLINITQSNTLLVCFLGMLLGYLILFLIFKKGKINKYVLILTSITILIICITANSVLNNTYLLFKTPPLIIMLSFLLLGIYGSNKGITNIARTSFIVGWFSLLMIILASFGLIGVIKINNLLPFLKEDFINILNGICIFTSTTLLPNIMLINYKGDLKFKDISKGYLIGCLTVILAMFLIISIFGYDLSKLVRFPEYLILKKINIGGFTNIENVIVIELLFTLLISGMTATKVLKDNTNKILFYIIMILIILSMTIFIFNTNYVNILYLKKYSHYVFMSLILISLLLKAKKSS